MKDITTIEKDIKNKFKDLSGYQIANNTVLDNYVLASSDAIHEAYKEIERNKNPHLYTGLKNTKEYEELGLLLNIPKRENEDDETYLYRLLNWQAHYEKGNYLSINDSLLNMQYASNANYVPFTLGTGTGTVYIILKEHTEENKKKAIEEARQRLKSCISPDSYIEYKVIEPIPVSFSFNLLPNKDADINNIKNNIEMKIKEYVNSLAPGESLKLLEINKIGLYEDNIRYFSISNFKVNNFNVNKTEIVQTSKNKFILDEIEWLVSKEEEDAN